MKKSILTLMSIVALFVTSCVQSDVDGVQTVGEETLVSLSVETSSASSRTIADGEKATKLQYAVYDENWNYIYTAEPVTLVDRKTTLELSLLSGTTYNFAFWADADKGYYTPDFPNKKVAVSYAGAEANDESRDAFYGILKVEVKGTTQASVDLKRPFAQVNFGANDLERAKDLGFKADNYTTEFTVSTYETLNFVDGSVEDAVEVTFAAKAPQSETTTLTAGGKDYAWISMNYVLCPAADASLNVCKMVATDGAKSFTVEYPMAPARRNWKTNLVGSLFTDSTKVEVEVTPGTDGEQGAEIGGQSYIIVKNADEFKSAFSNDKYDNIIFGEDIVLSEPLTRAADPALTISKDKALTIDLNNFTLSGSFQPADASASLFDVAGNLTIKNGTVVLTREDVAFSPNYRTCLFFAHDNGVVTLDGVTAKNNGGKGMAYVVDMSNSKNATINVEKSTLETPYIPVRVFNNDKSGKHNVTIKNSTLKGKYCVWVQFYLAEDGYTQDILDNQLNLDIFSNGNTLMPAEGKAPILFGYNAYYFYDANGNEWVADGASKDAEGNYLIYNAAGLKWVADVVNATAPYTPTIFDDKVVMLSNDIDLSNEEWIPIGDDRSQRTEFHGIFDGQGFTVKNVKITKKTDREDENKSSYGLFGNLKGTVKNLTVENVSISGAPKFIGALVGRMNDGLIENCHVKASSVECQNWTIGGLVGQFNNGKISGCSVENTTITGYAGVGAIAGLALNTGERTIENCSVKGCEIVKNGSFSGNYDLMFGGILGALYNGNLTVNLNNCSVENTTILGVESNALCGFVSEGDKLFVNGSLLVSTAAELESALKAGGNISLANDIALSAPIQIDGKTFSLNGNGHKIGQDSAYPLEGTTTTALLHPIGCTATIENLLFDGLKGDGPIRTVDTKLALNNVTVTNCERTATGNTAQGLFRLHGESTVTNCTLKNNVCPMGISLNWDGNNDLPQAVTGCVFEKNTCHATAVVYYVKGSMVKVCDNKFIDNTITVTGGSNAATLYLGFTENNVVTGNLFQNNTVNAGTSKRVAGGIMIGYAATITGNAFIGNTVNGEKAKGNDVCASVYYTDIDLSGNYWGGSAPVENENYFVEYPDNHSVIINDYLTENPIK